MEMTNCLSRSRFDEAEEKNIQRVLIAFENVQSTSTMNFVSLFVHLASRSLPSMCLIMISIRCLLGFLLIDVALIECRRYAFVQASLKLCDQFYNATNCYYFACVDSVYQCGEGNLLVQFSNRLCKCALPSWSIRRRENVFLGQATLEETFQSLTQKGRSWATAAQKCLMQELDYFLRTRSSTTCTQLDRFMLDRYPVCLTQSHAYHSFCSVLCENLSPFMYIFNHWNLPNVNLKRLFLEISRLCQEKSQMEYVIDINQSNVRIILWSLCLDSLRNPSSHFDPNRVMIELDFRPGLFANQEENAEDEQKHWTSSLSHRSNCFLF